MDNQNSDLTLFAETNFRNERRRFGIKRDDRRRHMYLIGKTGMGKSTMLENMILSDIVNGKGVAVVDPHGDLVEKIIDYIPSCRVNDVIYFNPADLDYPIAFNPLESIDTQHKHLVASGLIGIFKKLWADSWGPRLEYLLRNAILALLDNRGTTLLGIMRILIDKSYRKKIIANINDPVVKSFWVDEYSKYPDKFQVEAISPIQNKVGQFLSNFLIRNTVGQVKSSFDMRTIMDTEKILLLNLSKGRIGEDTSSLLGAMMITKIQLAAMDRIDIPEQERKDFYLYVDEFQNFATESFATILSEARKYRLNLIIAHQYMEQLNDIVRAAVFGNVGTMILFRIGAQDAEELVKEFTPRFTEEDLVNIPKWECYMKLMVDGIATDPFSARGLPPLFTGGITNNKEKVITLSRERYAERREIIEEKIARWSGIGEERDEQTDKKKEEKLLNNASEEFKVISERGERNNREVDDNLEMGEGMFLALCAICGKEARVNFKPDNVRPVFCKNCLKKVKKGEIAAPKINSNPKLNSGQVNSLSISAKSQISHISDEKNDRLIKLSKNIKSEAEDNAQSQEKEFSLSEAMKMGAVNFRGKKINQVNEINTKNEALNLLADNEEGVKLPAKMNNEVKKLKSQTLNTKSEQKDIKSTEKNKIMEKGKVIKF